MKSFVLFFLLFSSVFGDTLSLSGTVVSEREITITSRSTGFIKRIHVEEGQNVRKGDVLYEIDTNELDQSKRQVELSIAAATLSWQMHLNQLHNASLNLARHQRLYAKAMVAKAEVEHLELSVKNLQAMTDIAAKQIDQAKAQLATLMHQYAYLTIQAPHDGLVTQKYLREGEMAMPGVPALRLVDMESLRIHAQLPESYLSHVRVGSTVEVEIPALGLLTQGTVEAIIPVAATHTFKLKIAFEGTAYPGMFARVGLEQ
ncbi:MAG: efflux RND transporter periplasmic adaptor subunit [Campylobacterales bacterium]|nr:efflux RND transporter periplasmic adaptor subunit [Campylobacterales bacterium]